MKFSEENFKKVFRNTQATLAVEGLYVPEEMYDVYKKVFKGEITNQEFLKIAMEYAKT